MSQRNPYKEALLKNIDRIHLDYAYWIKHHDSIDTEDDLKIRQHIKDLQQQGYTLPSFSIVMPVYNISQNFLEEAIVSVQKQIYSKWQLCIADDCSTQPHIREVLERYRLADPRIEVIYRKENGHISEASNSALSLATGDFVVLLDNDDILPPHALYMVAHEIVLHPDANIIYSDEDKIDEEGRRLEPYFKPDWDENMMFGQNIISHLGVYRRSILEAIGGFRKGFEGSQDYDLALRVIGRSLPHQIRHIPFVLYHWRIHEDSCAKQDGDFAKPYAFVSAKKALVDFLQQHKRPAEVANWDIKGLQRVMYPIQGPSPLVSIVVPFKDEILFLIECVEKILKQSIYQNIEFILVNNQSKDPATFGFLKAVEELPMFRCLAYEEPFHWAKICNMAAQEARGDILLFIHNDTLMLNEEAIQEQVSHILREDVGAVGARLLYPDLTNQHCGIVAGMCGLVGHIFRNWPMGLPGYFGQAWMVRKIAAVSGACLMVKKDRFIKMHGFDTSFEKAYADIDFCLRLAETGLQTIYTPFSLWMHYEGKKESFSGGAPLTAKTFPEDAQRVLSRYPKYFANDPAYSPNLSLKEEMPMFAAHPRKKYPWKEVPSEIGRSS